jgi:hypothetical protein
MTGRRHHRTELRPAGGGFNLTAYYDPAERKLVFRLAFCGRCFFDGCTEISYENLIRAAQTETVALNLRAVPDD